MSKTINFKTVNYEIYKYTRSLLLHKVYSLLKGYGSVIQNMLSKHETLGSIPCTPIVLGFPVAQKVKNLPTMRETQVQSLSQEDPLEKGMATHSSILAWRIPWTEEPGGPQSTGSQRGKHD